MLLFDDWSAHCGNGEVREQKDHQLLVRWIRADKQYLPRTLSLFSMPPTEQRSLNRS